MNFRSILLILLFPVLAKAQLAPERNEFTARTGGRPSKGIKALTFGYDLVKDSMRVTGIYGNNKLSVGDLLSFKYFITDQTALRVGIRLYRDAETVAGEFADSTFYYNNPTSSGPATIRTSTSAREYVLIPGIEHHFSRSDFFDVYAGGDLIAALGREKTDSEVEVNNGDFSRALVRRNSAVIGAMGIVGFNLFVARLPVSIGLEYGLGIQTVFGGAYRVRREDRITDNGIITDYSSTYFLNEPYDPQNMAEGVDVPGSGQTQFKKLRMRQTGMNTNQQVRLTLNLYFGRK